MIKDSVWRATKKITEIQYTFIWTLTLECQIGGKNHKVCLHHITLYLIMNNFISSLGAYLFKGQFKDIQAL